jgi:hypothetical protein
MHFLSYRRYIHKFILKHSARPIYISSLLSAYWLDLHGIPSRDTNLGLTYTKTVHHHSIYKQCSLNLLFSSMFCKESKIVQVGGEKSSRFINNKFTSIWKILLTSNDEEDYADCEI